MKKILNICLVMAGMLALTHCGAALQFPEADGNLNQDVTDAQQDEKNREPELNNQGTLDENNTLTDGGFRAFHVPTQTFGPFGSNRPINPNGSSLGGVVIPPAPPPPPPPPVDPSSVEMEEFL